MNDTKLIEIYQMLSESELKRLDKFIASPYFNESKTILEMHNFIRAFSPDYNDPGLDKSSLWAELYPGEAHQDSRLRHFMSRLLKLLQEFLAQQSFSSDSFKKNMELLEALRLHKAEGNYQKTYRKFRKEFEELGTDSYLKNFLLDEELNRFYSISSLVTLQNIDSSLQTSAENLDRFYIVNKLRFFCSVINFKRVLQMDHRNRFMDEILEMAEEPEFQEEPAIKIYLLILQTLIDPEDLDKFKLLLDSLKDLRNEFEDEELRGMYVFAQNYCIRKANQGKTEFLQDLFNIYEQVISEGIIFSEGQFSAATYKNIVANALRLKKYNWAEAFIKDYNSKLPDEERENALTYNMARVHFDRRDYDQVITLLQQVEYSDVFYSLDSRSILLKTYYELDEVDSMEALVNSFRIFLRRNKILSEQQRKGYMNLIKFASQASRVRPRDKDRVNKLESDISNTSPIADVGWLKEKVAELKG